MKDRKEIFDGLCKSQACDFEFASNGFVRVYEDREKEKTVCCKTCSNEKVACTCMEIDDGMD